MQSANRNHFESNSSDLSGCFIIASFSAEQHRENVRPSHFFFFFFINFFLLLFSSSFYFSSVLFVLFFGSLVLCGTLMRWLFGFVVFVAVLHSCEQWYSVRGNVHICERDTSEIESGKRTEDNVKKVFVYWVENFACTAHTLITYAQF